MVSSPKAVRGKEIIFFEMIPAEINLWLCLWVLLAVCYQISVRQDKQRHEMKQKFKPWPKKMRVD